LRNLNKVICIGLLLCCNLFYSCTNNESTKFNKDFSIGVIETTGQKNKSIITFYDENLDEVSSQKLKLGSMGSNFNVPRVFDNKMYVVPQGIANKKEQTIILEFDLETGKTKNFDLKTRAMTRFCLNDKYLFGTADWNFVSKISRMQKATNQIKTLEFEKIHIHQLDVYNDILYAFGFEYNEKNEMKSYLYTIDCDKFTIIYKLDISEIGTSQPDTFFINNNLYFTNSLELVDGKQEMPSNTLCIMDLNTHSITNLALKAPFPSQILEYNNMLLITHNDQVHGEGNQITILDPNTHEMELFEFEHDLCQVEIKGEKLYAIDKEFLYVYNIKDDFTFELANKINAKTNKNDNTYFYISGIFTNH